MKSAGKYRIGTSGYSFKDWVGDFYDPGTASRDMFSQYVKHFNTVEINYTYYRMPYARTMQAMADKSPDDFTFWVKANQETTHKHNRTVAREYLEALLPMSLVGKLAGVLLQFPQSFHRTTINRKYLAETIEDFAAVPLAVEFRHNSWQHASTVAGLRDRNVTLAVPDVPDIGSLYHTAATATSRTGYLRLHSRNADKWYGGPVDRYDYNYSDDQLTEISRMWQEIDGELDTINVYFNNCHAAQAAENAEAFKRIVEQID